MDFYAKIGQRDQDSMTGFTGGLRFIKADIVKKLSEAGHTPKSYRQQTSLPNTLEFLQARKPAPAFDLDIEGLSEADCRDILVELFA